MKNEEMKKKEWKRRRRRHTNLWLRILFWSSRERNGDEMKKEVGFYRWVKEWVGVLENSKHSLLGHRLKIGLKNTLGSSKFIGLRKKNYLGLKSLIVIKMILAGSSQIDFG